MLRKLPTRYLAAVLAVLVLMLAVGSTAAAPLTGGNTIYVINGEEATFTFDPISRKDGLLLPQDVYATLGLSVAQSDKTVTVVKNSLQARIALGATTGTMGAEIITATPAPIKLSGRIFLPARLLEEFGYEVVSDSNYLQIRDLTQGIVLASGLDKAAYDGLRTRRTVGSFVKTDDQKSNVGVEVTFLTAEMVASVHFPATFRQRVQYLNLLQTNSLLLVRVANQTGRSATVKPESIMLVDIAGGKQYDVVQTLDYDGLIGNRIANGASKASILVYTKVGADIASLSVFADTNPGSIGTLTIK